MYEKICKTCGASLSEFYRTCMLGCPECYNSFQKEITVAVKKVHGKVYHTGKTTKIDRFDKELINEYSRVLKEKEQAVIDGRFDEVKELSERCADLYEELKIRGLL